jgi:hypothetical protein
MKKPKRKPKLTPKPYIIRKHSNLIQIVALIERTPNMVKVRTGKAA